MAMKYSRSLLFGVLLLIGFALTNSKATHTDPPVHCEFLNRSSFEPGFIFGTGSAAYQVCIYMYFTHTHTFIYFFRDYLPYFWCISYMQLASMHEL